MIQDQADQVHDDLEDLKDSGEVTTRTRSLSGGWHTFFYITAVAASLFHIGVNTFEFMVMPAIFRNACHLGFILIMAFLLYPWPKEKPDKGLRIDLLFTLLSAIVTIYILLFQQELHLERGSVPIMRDHIFAAIALIVLLIGTGLELQPRAIVSKDSVADCPVFCVTGSFPTPGSFPRTRPRSDSAPPPSP